MISDGQDNSSRYTYGELRKLLKEAGVQIYCIGIVEMGGGAGGTLDMQGQAILEEIAQTTGGKAFFPKSGAELEEITTRIALELRHQYSIGYNPTNVNRDGHWRKVKVSVKPPKGWPNLKVKHKEGYYAGPLASLSSLPHSSSFSRRPILRTLHPFSSCFPFFSLPKLATADSSVSKLSIRSSSCVIFNAPYTRSVTPTSLRVPPAS